MVASTRLQRRAGGAGAVGHAGLERLLDRGGQAAVGGLGLALEGVLAGELAVIHGLALALDGVDHGLQAFGQGRQGVGLALQQLERFLALVALRIGAQRGGDAGVELLRGQDAVAPAERGQQAQHGRSGDAGDRGAEGEAQALDRRGQRGADGVQVGGAFQRQAGAPQRDHHAQEGAEHAQQDQQADQVGRERGARQGGALAFDAQPGGVAQAGRQGVEPAGQRGGRGLQPGHRLAQPAGGAAVAVQLEGARHVEQGDQQRDAERQWVRADIARADPACRGQAHKKTTRLMRYRDIVS